MKYMFKCYNHRQPHEFFEFSGWDDRHCSEKCSRKSRTVPQRTNNDSASYLLTLLESSFVLFITRELLVLINRCGHPILKF